MERLGVADGQRSEVSVSDTGSWRATQPHTSFTASAPGSQDPGRFLVTKVRVDSDIVTAVTMKASVLRSWGLALTTAI